MPTMNRHLPHVKIDQFEGPFDLLLELAAAERVDITSISLGKITDDFLHYIRAHVIDPLVKGDFLIVAATLLAMKIRKLLPRLEVTSPNEANVAPITLRLRIYALYREQALHIRESWGTMRLLPVGFWQEELKSVAFAPLLPIKPAALAAHMEKVIALAPRPPMPTKHMVRTGRSLQQCLELWQTYLGQAPSVTFQEAMKTINREDIALSLLAALEMHRQGQVQLQQDTIFSSLYVTQRSKN